MKVIVVGGGNVGFTSAEALCKVHDVMVIEKDATICDNIKSLLNVSVLHEDGTNPRVLKSALELQKPDALLSTLPDDGLNLFICSVARSYHAEKNGPNSKPLKTVACIRNPDYNIQNTGDNLTTLISPEDLLASRIGMAASLENVTTYESLDRGLITYGVFHIEPKHDVVGKIVMDLKVPANCSIVAIHRGDNIITDVDSEMIHVGDLICVVGTSEAMVEFNSLVGIIKESREYVIIGATNAGINVAKMLLASGKRRFIKILDIDEGRCRSAIKQLDGVTVVNADVADPVVMNTENIDRADTIICMSPNDERNLLTCMAALRFGTPKIITRYNTKEYEEIFKYTGIHSIVGYHRVISNEMTKAMIYDDQPVIKLDGRREYFFSTRLGKNAVLAGRKYGDVKAPEGVRIIAIVREDGLEFPDLDTEFRTGDEVLIYANFANPVKLNKLVGHETPVEL